jgi:hypothetical protein
MTEELRRLTRAQSQRHPVEGQHEDRGAIERGEDSGRRPFGWVALVALVLVVACGWFVMRTMQADAKLQDCVMSGRKNCAPVAQPFAQP